MGWKAAALLVVFAVLLAAVAGMPAFGAGSPPKQLLILHSYHKGYKWTDDVSRGVEAALQNEGRGVRVRHEFMDTKRFSDPAYFELLYQTYKHKFGNSRFDVITASDNDAFNFLLKHRDDLFPGTPVVFCGVNYFEPSQLRGAKLFTGVNEAPDVKATLDLALKLHPKTRRIVVINDTTTTGLVMHREITKLIPAYRGRVAFTFLEEAEMPEILATVQKLPADALVFYTLFLRDKAGRVFDYDEGISLIAEKCPVPIFGVWDFNLGLGMVGGMLTSGYYQGETAGRMAVRILRGERVENIPPVMKSPNRYMFDYRQLKRFGVDLSALPAESIFINRPLPLYSVPRAVLWVAIAALAALVTIILLLLRIVAIRKRAEEALLLNEARLEALARLNEMTGAPLREITDFTLEGAVRLTRSTVGYLAFLNDDETILTIHSWSRVALAECMTATKPLEFRVETMGLWGEAIRQRKPVITNDYRAVSPYKKGYPPGHVELSRHMNAPIFDEGRIVALAGVGNKETEYDETDVRQLTLLMQGMWRLVQRGRAEETLRESAERYRTLFEGANDAIVTIRDGLFVNCNRTALEMFRCTAEKFLGRAPEQFSPPVQPDGRESGDKAGEKITAALAGRPQLFEWQHRRCDGALFEAEVSLNLVEYQGKVELLAIIRDVTERKEMERLKDEMISAVSHEMRTPLTAMLGFTEFMLEHEVEPQQQKEYLGVVYSETERLSELIGNFLDLQRMKARQMVYRFKSVAVRPLLEEVAALFAGATQKHRITVEATGDLPPVRGDEARLHQVLNNFLSNAVKYSPKGGEIILGARRDGEDVIIRVQDEGRGIAPDLLDKIFERFYQVDSSDRRMTGGAGLGLALVREIVSAHGGRVWAESTEGKGSTFYVALPVMK